MSLPKTTHLHLVSEDEAALLELRSKARTRFISKYPKPESRRTMLGALDRIALTFSGGLTCGKEFPWEILVDEFLAEEVWDSVLKKYKTATAKRDAAALKAMLACCWKVGLMTYEQLVSAISFSTTIANTEAKSGRSLDQSEMAQLVNYEDQEAHPTLRSRDLATVLLMASTGARRNEIAHIDLGHLDLANSSVRLMVTKNGHPRDAWLHPAATESIKRWIDLRGFAEGALLVPLSRTCRPLTERRLSTHQIWKIIGKRAAASGVGHLTPHDLRRYLVSTLLDQGVDLALVARIVGHKNPATTAGYDRRPDERCREAIAGLALPSPFPNSLAG